MEELSCASFASFAELTAEVAKLGLECELRFGPGNVHWPQAWAGIWSNNRRTYGGDGYVHQLGATPEAALAAALALWRSGVRRWGLWGSSEVVGRRSGGIAAEEMGL